jgi:ethanolamine ammonia-lyase small subunit
MNDVGYVLEEVWRGRSALSGSLDKLTLVKWDPEKPLDTDNLICLTRKEADRHLKLKREDFTREYSQEFLDYVRDRFELEKNWSKCRY